MQEVVDESRHALVTKTQIDADETFIFFNLSWLHAQHGARNNPEIKGHVLYHLGQPGAPTKETSGTGHLQTKE